MVHALLSAESREAGRMWILITLVVIAMSVLAIAGFQASLRD